MKVRQRVTLAALALTIPLAAAAEAAPAEAPKASVTVYGTLNVNVQSTMAKGATDPAKNVDARGAVSTDSSNVGVKAQAEVVGGLSAIGQCETSANVDAIGTSGLCNRNSRVGLTGGFGTLFFGNWDTPLKTVTYGNKLDDPFGSTDVFGFQSIIGSPGFNARSGGWVTATPGAADAAGAFPAGSVIHGFDTRANNAVAYFTPSFMGLSGKILYSVDELANAKANVNPNLLSAGINFDWMGLSVGAAIDRREDAFGLAQINYAGATDGTPAPSLAFGATAGNPAAIGSVDTGWRIGVGYELPSPFGATTVSYLIDHVGYVQDHAPVDSIKEYGRYAWQLSAKHRMGDHELRVRYDRASGGDCTVATGSAISCSTVGYGAKQFTLGYAYYLSKSAQAYLSFTKLMNDPKATYTLTIGGAPEVAGKTVPGADPQAIGLGIRYTF